MKKMKGSEEKGTEHKRNMFWTSYVLVGLNRKVKFKQTQTLSKEAKYMAG
jgi:hypothetical protein